MTEDQLPPMIEISLGDLAEIMEGEAAEMIEGEGLTAAAAAQLRGAALLRSIAAPDQIGGHNDNDPDGEQAEPARILEFPSAALARRRLDRFRLTHHADGTPLSTDELHDRLELAVIEEAAIALEEFAIERADGGYELAAIMLLRAAEIADANALVERAERILGPRRYGPGHPAPEAA